MKLHRRHFLISGAALTVAGCETGAIPSLPTRGGGGGTVVSVAQGDSRFSTLVTAVEAAGLAETLSGPGPFTLFAPTNAAFDILPEGALDGLLLEENRDVLTNILTYHVVPGRFPASALVGQTGTLPSVAGPAISVDGTGDTVLLEEIVPVVEPDITASNGLVHAIGGLLVPPDIEVGALAG